MKKGALPARRDISILESHHSGPRYRLLHSMGPWGKDQDYSSNKRSWSYWHGSKGAWRKNKPPKDSGDQGKGKHSFPQYDSVKVDSSQGQGQKLIAVMTKKEPGAHGTSEENLVKELQASINQARKAEGKVKRILSEREQKTAQWTAYDQEMKSAYLTEKKRRIHSMEQLEAESKQALAQQEDARSKVREAGEASDPTEDHSMGSVVDDKPWEDMVTQ